MKPGEGVKGYATRDRRGNLDLPSFLAHKDK